MGKKSLNQLYANWRWERFDESLKRMHGEALYRAKNDPMERIYGTDSELVDFSRYARLEKIITVKEFRKLEMHFLNGKYSLSRL